MFSCCVATVCGTAGCQSTHSLWSDRFGACPIAPTAHAPFITCHSNCSMQTGLFNVPCQFKRNTLFKVVVQSHTLKHSQKLDWTLHSILIIQSYETHHIHTCTCACTHACMHACTHACMHACIHTHRHTLYTPTHTPCLNKTNKCIFYIGGKCLTNPNKDVQCLEWVTRCDKHHHLVSSQTDYMVVLGHIWLHECLQVCHGTQVSVSGWVVMQLVGSDRS